MKRLTSQLRNKDFDTFLKFFDCILRAGSHNPKVNLSILDSIQGAIANFDERYGTSYSPQLNVAKQQHSQMEQPPPPVREFEESETTLTQGLSPLGGDQHEERESGNHFGLGNFTPWNTLIVGAFRIVITFAV